MPGRQEFETELDNEAENIVKDLVFLDEDTTEERGPLSMETKLLQ
jgi:transcriptional adapter 2-alpha